MPFINIQGKNICYYQNGNYQSNRLTLLFVHGAGGTGKNWAYQLSGIKDYNLIAPDLPGHGLSEGSAFDTIVAYQEFIWRFVQALNLKSFVIGGHSMGGAIAMQFSLVYPQVLKGLIIVDSGARLMVNPKILKLLSQKIYPLEIIKYLYSSTASQKVLEQADEEMKKTPTEVHLADYKACNNFNIMDSIKNISVPVLIICGQDDQMTPVKYSKYLSQELRESQIAYIPNAGHMAMLEQPKQVNQAIQEFMVKLTDGPKVLDKYDFKQQSTRHKK